MNNEIVPLEKSNQEFSQKYHLASYDLYEGINLAFMSLTGRKQTDTHEPLRNILEINPSESIENFESLNNEQRLLWLKQVYGIDEITNTVYLDNMTIYDYDNSNQVIENFKSSILDDIYNLGLEDFYLSREDCYHIGLGEDYDQELDDEQEYLEHCHEQDEVDDELEL